VTRHTDNVLDPTMVAEKEPEKQQPTAAAIQIIYAPLVLFFLFSFFSFLTCRAH
jgi:hypothetical protein